MAFRTLEISNPSEIHVRNGQLTIQQDEGMAVIPLEDIATIICRGANIRLSTMAMAQISSCGITLMIQNERYAPAGILIPYEANARQSLVMKMQINMSAEMADRAWMQIIQCKIKNQSRVLELLDMDGADEIARFADEITPDNVDSSEAYAAKCYFKHLDPGLSRRKETPFNSRLNYGYAVVRNALIRALLNSGFLPAFGLHHRSQLNTNNLADDLIEPWRPMVDIIASQSTDNNVILDKSQRFKLAHVLHNACLIDGKKMAIISAIDEMVQSFHSYVNGRSPELALPILIRVESAELLNQ